MLTLTPDLLLQAYAAGIFPMAESADDPELFWVDPQRRGIIPLEAFHVPRRLRRTVRNGSFEIRCDTAFAEVMRSCAAATSERPQTWINEEIVEIYTALFRRGAAHSVEAWLDGTLVGGLYGVHIGAAFFGESMFSRVTDASKVALVHLVARLRRGGFVLLDTQFTTAHLERFGAIEITRREYHARLKAALSRAAQFGLAPPGDVLSSLQSSTPTS
jgi:leucyl/phenylalanyl-tRNA---protein transferase